MDKKTVVVYTLLLCIIISILSSCKLSDKYVNNNSMEPDIEIQNLIAENAHLYEFKEKKYMDTEHINSCVTISYPQIDNQEYTQINNLIKNFVKNISENIYGNEYEDVTLDLLYEITYSDNKYISLVFRGQGNVSSAAYPNRLLIAVNIDIVNSEILSFYDIYNKDNELLKTISDNFNIQFVPGKLKELKIKNNDESFNKIKQQLSTIGINNIDELLIDNTKFYFTENSVCFCVDIPHAVGDYFVVTVEYSEVERFLKNKDVNTNIDYSSFFITKIMNLRDQGTIGYWGPNYSNFKHKSTENTRH